MEVGFYTRHTQCVYLAQDSPNTCEPSPFSEQNCAFCKNEATGVGPMLVEFPVSSSSTGEDEMLGVVAIMVDEVYDIWRWVCFIGL